MTNAMALLGKIRREIHYAIGHLPIEAGYRDIQIWLLVADNVLAGNASPELAEAALYYLKNCPSFPRLAQGIESPSEAWQAFEVEYKLDDSGGDG